MSLHINRIFSLLADGQLGKRVLFINDFDETFLISFEEGMQCMDMLETMKERPFLHSEYRERNRYLHQVRTDPKTRRGIGNYAFFHMELTDDDGNVHILPGQMTAPFGYQWSQGVEPVLIQLMSSLAVCSTGDVC